jgi:hypothetical protein
MWLIKLFPFSSRFNKKPNIYRINNITTRKRFGNRITTWLWDGNVPLHERTETRTPDYSEERGYFDDIRTEPVITWVFEEGTFVPALKIKAKQKLSSIVANYMGTPEAMFREDGEKVWTCELNSYGRVRNFQGEYKKV